MFNRILILSKEEALRTVPGMKRAAVVSIVDKQEDNPDWKKAGVPSFNMRFNDTENRLSDMSAGEKDFSGLKHFLDSTDADTLVVHCFAGISRSAGAAAAIAEYLGIRMRIWTDRRYDPNVLVYELVKKSLQNCSGGLKE